MEQNTENSLFELQIDHNGSAFLKETAKWAKFLAIVGFVFCGLILLAAIFAGSMMASTLGRLGTFGASGGVMISVIYILLGLVYFFPCLYLYNFASKMQTALRNNDQEQLNVSLRNLKSCYRFCGILLIIILGLYALIFIFGMIAVAFR